MTVWPTAQAVSTRCCWRPACAAATPWPSPTPATRPGTRRWSRSCLRLCTTPQPRGCSVSGMRRENCIWWFLWCMPTPPHTHTHTHKHTLEGLASEWFDPPSPLSSIFPSLNYGPPHSPSLPPARSAPCPTTPAPPSPLPHLPLPPPSAPICLVFHHGCRYLFDYFFNRGSRLSDPLPTAVRSASCSQRRTTTRRTRPSTSRCCSGEQKTRGSPTKPNLFIYLFNIWGSTRFVDPHSNRTIGQIYSCGDPRMKDPWDPHPECPLNVHSGMFIG